MAIEPPCIWVKYNISLAWIKATALLKRGPQPYSGSKATGDDDSPYKASFQWGRSEDITINVPRKHKVGQGTQKQDGTQHAFFKKCGVGSCALHEIDVRSLLKHRARWWHQGPQFTTACCVSYVYILLVAISANVINSIPSF